MQRTQVILPLHVRGACLTALVGALGLSGSTSVSAAETTPAPAAATAPAVTPAPATPPPAGLVVPERGVEITAVRLSANGYMVDLRYKVLDADKAKAMSDPAAKPYLLDQASGSKLLVPNTPKIGPLRQSAQKPEVGRVYFTLFNNAGRAVTSGSKVTLVVGECRIENLTVE